MHCQRYDFRSHSGWQIRELVCFRSLHRPGGVLLLHQRLHERGHHQLLNVQITPITLADVTIRLETPEPVLCTSNFRPFLGESGGQSVIGRAEFETVMFSVHRTEDGFVRRYRDQDGRYYAVGWTTPKGVEIRYLPWSQAYFSETHNCFSHIALEELLLLRERLILHAAFVAVGERGLLFSGPSGIGKSTQAALWERHGACLRSPPSDGGGGISPALSADDRQQLEQYLCGARQRPAGGADGPGAGVLAGLHA